MAVVIHRNTCVCDYLRVDIKMRNLKWLYSGDTCLLRIQLEQFIQM